MITKYSLNNSDANRKECLDYIKKNKETGCFTVIDIGGSACGWTSNVSDVLVDFIDPEDFNNSKEHFKNIKFFKFDITDPDGWTDLLNYCKENGKFDFSICSHTLEDITNPVFVSKQLAKISKQGYIAFPSKYCEMGRGEAGPYGWRGCCHHRWIFDIKDNELFAFPKLNCIEYIKDFDNLATNDQNRWDLAIYWENDFHINEVNGWLNVQDIINKLYNLL